MDLNPFHTFMLLHLVNYWRRFQCVIPHSWFPAQAIYLSHSHCAPRAVPTHSPQQHPVVGLSCGSPSLHSHLPLGSVCFQPLSAKFQWFTLFLLNWKLSKELPVDVHTDKEGNTGLRKSRAPCSGIPPPVEQALSFLLMSFHLTYAGGRHKKKGEKKSRRRKQKSK